MQQDLFDALKGIPYVDEDMISNMKWADPNQILKSLKQRHQWPPLDVAETSDEIIIRAAIPGLQYANDVQVEIKGNTITLEGEIKPTTYASSLINVHQEEICQGKFSRTITLPIAINNKGARAAYKQGILEIRISKVQGNQIERLKVSFF